jgi:hypothetical protein
LCGIVSERLGGIGKSLTSDDLSTSEILNESLVTAHVSQLA